jgi:membrane protease YdiL (CAAX protease family)
LNTGYTLGKDPHFLLAILAAPVAWLALYFIVQPNINWLWPLQHPARFLWPALFAPVVEEILFRGLLQEFIRDYFSEKFLGPVSIANLVTSLVFTGLHFFFQPALWAALVFVPSLVFGHFKDRTGKLTAPIILHTYYNFGFLWVFSAPG